jgi:hypothetical protein
MTPKEKAVELYNKYEQLGKDFTRGVSMAEFAKQCALIAVDVIIEVLWHTHKEINQQEYRYYLEVKQEIEKL